MPRSTLGKQSYSKFKSEPSFGFGVATREQAGKVFVSQEHTALATAGTTSPGAIYDTKPSVGGKQSDGSKPDPPVWKFGTSNRFPARSRSDFETEHNYHLPNLVGQKPTPGQLSRVRSEPHFGFGTATREQVARAMTEVPGIESPGPASYSLQGALGRISSSRYGSEPTYSISSRAWAPDGSAGREGGVQYALPQSVGAQVETTPGPSYSPGLLGPPAHQRSWAWTHLLTSAPCPGPTYYSPALLGPPTHRPC